MKTKVLEPFHCPLPTRGGVVGQRVLTKGVLRVETRPLQGSQASKKGVFDRGGGVGQRGGMSVSDSMQMVLTPGTDQAHASPTVMIYSHDNVRSSILGRKKKMHLVGVSVGGV